jgi:hypothetical protein
MKLSNMQILNPLFVPTLDKLMRKNIPITICAELSDSISEIETKIANVQKVKDIIVDKYLEKDEKGQVVVIDGKTPKYKNDEAQQKFVTEVNELLRGEFEISFNSKIDLDESDTMSVQEYMLIKNFVNVKNSSNIIDASK